MAFVMPHASGNAAVGTFSVVPVKMATNVVTAFAEQAVKVRTCFDVIYAYRL